MARMLHNWMRGLVLLALLLGAAWMLRTYRLAFELKDRQQTAAASTHEMGDLRTALRSMSGDSHAPATTKPWVDDVAGYERTHPGKWIVGQSKVACVSQAEAIAAARDDAAKQMGELIQTPAVRTAEHDWIVRRIAADIRDGQMQSDSAVEQFERPYGTIWVGAVLVDASAERLSPVIQRYAFDAHRRVALMFGVRMAAIGMALMVWLVYFPMNWATKGFFARRLRFGAVAMTAAVMMFLV